MVSIAPTAEAEAGDCRKPAVEQENRFLMWNPQANPQPDASFVAGQPLETKLEMDDSAQRSRLNQIFNTALVSSHAETKPDSASEIHSLMESPGFGAILQSIQLLAGERGVSEIEAARELIRTFRRMDRLWTDYLVSEGVERLKLSN